MKQTDIGIIGADSNPANIPLPVTPSRSQRELIETASITPSPKMNVQDNDDTHDIDKTLGDVLERIFTFIRLSAKNPHEILLGLSNEGVTDWNAFIYMDVEDIKKTTLIGKHGFKHLSTSSVRLLSQLKLLVEENIEKGLADAKNPSIYTTEMFEEFHFRKQQERRDSIYQSVNTSNLPAITSNTSKSPGEKKYDAWIRGRRSKESFVILKTDKQYISWKIKFHAELFHQKLDHVIDTDFDPTILTCSFERELWKEQLTYFWTVLLYIFENPLGKICITEHLKDRDARTAFLIHQQRQEKSPAKIYNTSGTLGLFLKLSIGTYEGSRVAFMARWFELFELLNENSRASTTKYGFDFARSSLLQALQDDSDLLASFRGLVVTGDESTDMVFFKEHFLEEAALWDGRNDLLKRGRRNPNTIIKAHTRQLSEIYDSADISAIQDIQEYAINRTMRSSDPRARLPDHIFSKFTPEEKSGWRNMPESGRIKMVGLIGATTTGREDKPQSRRSYITDVTSDQSTIPSTLTDNDAFIEGIKLLIQSHETRSQGPLSSPDIIPPPSVHFSGTSTPHSSNRKALKTQQKDTKPLLSTLDPAHPAAVMSKPRVPVYDKQGTCQGYINAGFHRWLTPDDQDETLTTKSPDGNSGDTSYTVSNRQISNSTSMSLVDRGANGIVGGADCVLIGKPSVHRSVSITGLDNHQLPNVPIATVGAHVMSNRGPVICIFNEVAYTGKHQSILSAIQLEHYGNDVDDKSKGAGGKAQISTPDGFIFPLSTMNGLPYLHMRPYTNNEYDDLPHVIMTSDKVWDPRCFDQVIDPNEEACKLPEQLHY